MVYNPYITNTATSIFSIIVFQTLSALQIGDTDIERGLYVFVCWFFVFIIGLYLYAYLPKSIGSHVINFATSLMIDGILILTGTLFIMWTFPLFAQNAPSDAPIAYFSLYYFIFASLIKFVAQKKFILNVSRIAVIFLFVLFAVSIFPVPITFQPYTFILAGLDILFLLGLLLYYFLNKILSGLAPQKAN